MSSLSLRFWKPHDLIGNAVCWKTDSDVAHVSVIVDGLEIEALPGINVDYRFPRPFIGREYEFTLGFEAHDSVSHYINSIIGDSYDYKKVLSFIFPWVRGDERRLICSELAYGVMYSAGLIPEIVGQISPRDLELLAIQRKFDILEKSKTCYA